MTQAELFKALVDQGGPAAVYDPETGVTSCSYRLTMPDGSLRKCAAGQMISDADYRLSFEGRNIDSLVAERQIAGMPDWARTAQEAHDLTAGHVLRAQDAGEIVDWAEALAEKWARHGLDTVEAEG